jgi:hypothetical protein
MRLIHTSSDGAGFSVLAELPAAGQAIRAAPGHRGRYCGMDFKVRNQRFVLPGTLAYGRQLGNADFPCPHGINGRCRTRIAPGARRERCPTEPGSGRKTHAHSGILTGQLAGQGRPTAVGAGAIDTQNGGAYVLIRSGNVHVDLHHCATSQPHEMRMGDRRGHFPVEIVTALCRQWTVARPGPIGCDHGKA